MGYSKDNFIATLHKSVDFTDVIAGNGYDSVDGNCQSFYFEKVIKTNQLGHNEKFTIYVSNQISGFVTAKLDYIKKLEESASFIEVHEHLSIDSESLDLKIKECEKRCLLIGEMFNK